MGVLGDAIRYHGPRSVKTTLQPRSAPVAAACFRVQIEPILIRGPVVEQVRPAQSKQRVSHCMCDPFSFSMTCVL